MNKYKKLKEQLFNPNWIRNIDYKKRNEIASKIIYNELVNYYDKTDKNFIEIVDIDYNYHSSSYTVIVREVVLDMKCITVYNISYILRINIQYNTMVTIEDYNYLRK